jgi:hypothetical protein
VSVLLDLSSSLSVILAIDVAEPDLGDRSSVSDLLKVTVGAGRCLSI